MSTFTRLFRASVSTLCGLLLINPISAQAGVMRADLISLTSYADANITFSYPAAWFSSSNSSSPTNVSISNEKTGISDNPVLNKSTIIVNVIAGPAAVAAVNHQSDTMSVLKALMTNSAPGTVYSKPQMITLMNSADAVMVTATDAKSTFDAVLMVLTTGTNPVIVTAGFGPGQFAANEMTLIGIVSSIQASGGSGSGTSSTAASGAVTPLTSLLSNKVYTLSYPDGWFTSSSGDNASVYLATDQALADAGSSGTFTLAAGQTLVGITSGRQVYSIASSSPDKPPSAAALITGMKAQFVSSSHAIFSQLGTPSPLTVGTVTGAEATISLKTGGTGYVIVFYQNKTPVLLIAMTTVDNATKSRSLFEQIAATITVN